MVPFELDIHVKINGTSMPRNQRNLWFHDKFKIDERTGKSLFALSPAKKHSFARPKGMQHDVLHLTICGMASWLGRKLRARQEQVIYRSSIAVLSKYGVIRDQKEEL